MRYRYYICDVFTDTRFGGNQLAVLPEADGLTDRQMQQIAREFNFAVSAKLNSRAICCIWRSVRPSAWGNTAS